jgi:Tn3 transposase DDE domain
LRESITAITNRVEAFHGFADWLAFGAEDGVIAHNDPVYQEKLIKFNQLLANCVIYQTACDITATANTLAAEGHPVDPADLATISPHSPAPSAASVTGTSTSPRRPIRYSRTYA